MQDLFRNNWLRTERLPAHRCDTEKKGDQRTQDTSYKIGKEQKGKRKHQNEGLYRKKKP